jgi:serine-type D-Ala-D-Ala carboxypeptidase (penicillin-binding protein 5/6)
VLALLAAIYIAFALLRGVPAPALASVHSSGRFPGPAPALAWPARGQAAVAISGLRSIDSHGATRPVPIASVAKVMTAYVVLSDHPLHGAQQGPALTVTAADAVAYHREAAAGQSVLPVRAGERLTERQALEGLLLPSGNNVAALLAAWDAGSQGAFVARMNATARTLGLRRTRYTGASGVASSTVSTATDQVRLAEVAFALPVFRQIVGMSEATLPVAGRQFNVDSLLGQDGIVGIKTGTTIEAGGCFVFAARVRAAGRLVTVIGAVLAQQPSRSAPGLLAAAFAATKPLLASARRAVHVETLVALGARLTEVRSQWTAPVALVAAHAVRVLGWRGLRVTTTVPAARLAGGVRAGKSVTTAIVTVGAQRFRVPLVAATDVSGPSFGWRLEHP